MGIALAIILLLMGSIFFSIIFNKKIEQTIILYILSMISFVYIFGLFGNLKLGVYGLISISIILFIISIVLFIKSKKKKKILKNIFTPGLLIFFILNVVLMYFERGRMFTKLDEFSHWGSAIKSMFKINDFSTNPDSSLMFKSYPPAMTIFQYIFVFLKGEFIEYYAYYSYCIFCFSLILPITSNIEWKNISKIIIYTVTIVLLPSILYKDYFYVSIQIDVALGLTFGFIISKVISTKTLYNIYDLLLIYLSLTILVLLKDTGIFLAIIAIIIFAIDNIFYKNKIKINRENIKIILKKTILICIPILLVLITKLSWSYLINVNNADKMFSGSYDIKQIIKIILGIDTTYRTTVMENFINACFTRNIYSNIIPLNTVQLSIIFCMLFIVCSKICRYEKRENTCLIVTIIGLFLYLFGLMITYMFKFNQTEALGIYSFERYIPIYFTSLLFICIYSFMNYNRLTTKTLLIITLIILFISPLQIIQQLHKTAEQSAIYRSNYINETNKINNIVKENDRLFFIDKQNPDYGMTYWITRFSLIPIKFNTNEMFNITSIDKNANAYLVYYPFEKLKETIFNEYDYVYINGIDEGFIEEYGSLFKNLTAHSLYKVEKENLVKIY